MYYNNKTNLILKYNTNYMCLLVYLNLILVILRNIQWRIGEYTHYIYKKLITNQQNTDYIIYLINSNSRRGVNTQSVFRYHKIVSYVIDSDTYYDETSVFM